MKKILFPQTYRSHGARQQLLIKELKKSFDVDIWEPVKQDGPMAVSAIMYAIEFNNFLASKNYDAVIIRGDRFEMLGLAMVACYRGIRIIHIEGGDLSGAVDNKVRQAITQLADYHFVTNEESQIRLVSAGISINNVWNFGSLDVEYTTSIKPKRIKSGPYMVVAFHPIPGEDEKQLEQAVKQFYPDYSIQYITSNKDYGRQYGTENYTPEDYVNLMRGAACLIGNSSSFLKEASILGTPVVNVGSRQEKRLKPKNVLDVPCDTQSIKLAVDFQLKNKYQPDLTYYKADTSKHITAKLKEVL